MIEATKTAHPRKKRKSLVSTSKAGPFETFEIIDDDNGTAQRIKVIFLEPLVNSFEGGIFWNKDKLDEI